MSKVNIKEKVIECLSERLGHQTYSIKDDSKIVEDLGADSLDEVEILMFMEDEFDVEIPDEDGQKWKTVSDIVEYLEKVA